tara:strand:- start:163 stop:378 length:216 start_codon:yes stop_codon:yes gene_type:complete
MNSREWGGERLEFMRRSAQHAERQKKQAVWKAHQSALPEFTGLVEAFGKRIGGLAVQPSGGEWVTWDQRGK